MTDDELRRPPVDRQHATLGSAYPPGEDTMTGRMMLRIASGAWEDSDELVEEFQEMAQEFEDFFPDDDPVAPADVPGLLNRVVAEHQRVIPVSSYDADVLLSLPDLFFSAGLLLSWGDGFDSVEATEYAAGWAKVAREEGHAVRGYAYAHLQDLDRLILTGRLYLGFGVFGPQDDAAAAAIGREVADILRECQFPVEWDGNPDARIILDPLLFEIGIED